MGLFALYSVLWQAIAGCALFAYNPRLPYAVGTLLSLAVVFLALVLVARPLPGSPRDVATADPVEFTASEKGETVE